MSGGHFDYKQYAIDDIANSIEDYIYGHELDDWQVQDILHDRNINEAEEYAVAHHHTMPNRHGYRFLTLQQLKRAVHYLRKAAVYAQRADWLLSGDDSEESFHERLKKDLAGIAKGREVDF